MCIREGVNVRWRKSSESEAMGDKERRGRGESLHDMLDQWIPQSPR